MHPLYISCCSLEGRWAPRKFSTYIRNTHIMGGVLEMYKAARAFICITVDNLGSNCSDFAVFLYVTLWSLRKEFLPHGWQLSNRLQGIILQKMIIGKQCCWFYVVLFATIIAIIFCHYNNCYCYHYHSDFRLKKIGPADTSAKTEKYVALFGSRLLPNSATYTHQQGPTNICSQITTHRCILIGFF